MGNYEKGRIRTLRKELAELEIALIDLTKIDDIRYGLEEIDRVRGELAAFAIRGYDESGKLRFNHRSQR